MGLGTSRPPAMTRFRRLLPLTLLLVGCARHVTNPLLDDDELRTDPAIIELNRDTAGHVLIPMDRSYYRAELEVQRRGEVAFVSIPVLRLAPNLMADASVDFETTGSYSYRVIARMGEQATYPSREQTIVLPDSLNPPTGF